MTKKRRLGQAQKAIKMKNQSLKKERVPTLGMAPKSGAPPKSTNPQAGIEFDNIQLDSAQEY